MSTANDVIASSLKASAGMLRRYCEDLKPEEYLHRTSEQANCAAWIVGHLAVTDRSVLKRLGMTDLPALPDGFEQRFSREGDAPRQKDFGDVSILLPLFEKHRLLFIERIRQMSLADLDKPLEKPHPMFKTIGELGTFIAIHTAMHAGQITLIRRSLGRPPLT